MTRSAVTSVSSGDSRAKNQLQTVRDNIEHAVEVHPVLATLEHVSNLDDVSRTDPVMVEQLLDSLR